MWLIFDVRQKMSPHIEISQGVRLDDLATLQERVRLRGGNLRVYAEVVSIFFICARSYRVRWVATEKEAKGAGTLSSVISAILGWWSLFGPYHTISAIVWNGGGGVDVSESLLRMVPGSKLLLTHPQASAIAAYEEKVRRTTLWIFWSAVLLVIALVSWFVWSETRK